jgi:protein-S-isoprenylcysteine O-methyltransferase Ste14
MAAGDLIALMTIMFWLVIPLFWIPVHLATNFFKRLGLLTYIMPVLTWIPLAYLAYHHRAFLLQSKIEVPAILAIAGVALLVSGTLLHFWTGWLLRPWGIIGVPEVSTKAEGQLVTGGPFSVVRHPTYLAHTLMFFGVFSVTGVISVGIVALLDFSVVNAFIIPLEERELLKRFGEDYGRYQQRVPRYFPWPRLAKKVSGV